MKASRKKPYSSNALSKHVATPLFQADVRQTRHAPQIPVSDGSSDGQGTSALRFLELPQELRDMVYVYLLCPHIDGTRHRKHEKIRHYGLEPAILRTCKQVCEEASKVLYTKNGTVLIRLDAQADQALDQPGAFQGCPIAQVECGSTGGLPVLTMEISVPQKSRAKAKSVPTKEVVFIGFLSALPNICRFISSCWSVGTFKLVVHMEKFIARPPENRSQTISDCLESLCEARKLGVAVILIESPHKRKAAKIARLMTTNMGTFDDALSIACAYEARVLRYFKEERWNDARDTLENALGFFDRVRAMRLIETRKKYEYELSLEKGRELEVRRINTQWIYVSCCLRIGRTGDVHHQIGEMFHTSRRRCTMTQQKGYWDREADAHYAIGKAYEIDGAVNSAVYSFLEALVSAPGHIEADRAVDQLEERVKSSSKPKDMVAKLNIECVLKEVRHRMPDGHLTEDQNNDLISSFIATCGEIEALIDPFSSVSAI